GGGATIDGTVTGSSVSLLGGTGSDAILIDFAGGASLPVGLSVTRGSGTHTMTGKDAATSTPPTYTIASRSVNRTGSATLTYAAIESLVVKGGDGGSTFNVQSTLATTPVTITGGAGNDVFNFSSDAPANTGDLSGLAGAVTVDGSGGTNTLNVSEAG